MVLKKNILSLSLTRELLKSDPSQGTDDSYMRMSFYGRHLKGYYVLVHSLRKHRLGVFKTILPNFWVYGTNGYSIIDSFFKLFYKGYTILKKHPIHLIQAQDPIFTGAVAMVLSYLFRKPYNVCVYGTDPYDKYFRQTSFFYKYFSALPKFVLKKADGIQVDGKKVGASLIENGILKDKVYYKPMIPTNIEKFLAVNKKDAKDQQGAKINTKTPVLLFVGRIVRQKNISMLIRVIQQLKIKKIKCKLLIIGEGPLLATLKQQAHKLDLLQQIHFLGRVPHQQVVDYFELADIFVLPSFYEGFPRVLMEAAATGTPILTTDVSGARDVLTSEYSGIIVPIQDETTFEKKLEWLIKNPKKRQAFGERVKADFLKTIDKYANLKLQVDIWKNLTANK